MDDPRSLALFATAERRGIVRNASASSSISKLNYDILMQIFLMNASMDEDPPEYGKCIARNPPQRAIDITRICSQVSFQWRTIIVNTGWLWSKLIDLDVLDISGSNWRDEVLRRTKEVPLHVKGSIDLERFKEMNEPWWFGFLNDQWRRIRVFDVSVVSKGAQTFRDFDMDYDKTDEFQKALPFLARSTTTLESFRLNLPCPCDPLGPDSSLFGDDAPRLRSFQIQHWPINLCTKRYTWVPRLHNLSILEYYGRTFATVDDLCQLLSQIPHLRSLYLTDAIDSLDGVIHVTSPKRRVAVRLPFLDRIELRSTDYGLNASRDRYRAPAIYWALLDSIVPKPGFSVRVLTADVNDILPDIDSRILLRYAKDYFKINPPQKLKLRSSNAWFRLTDLSWPAYASQYLTAFEVEPLSLSEMPFLDFDLTTRRDFYQEALAAKRIDVMYELLSSLFSLTFPSVIELEIDVSHSHDVAFETPAFRDFLSSFSSVTKISIALTTLHLLNTSPVIEITTLFPRLRILSSSLHHTTTFDDSSLSPQAVLTTFLQLRGKAGLPLAIFEYEHERQRKLTNLTFLDEFSGLKVVWKSRIGGGEYICGSGRPEELDIMYNIKKMLGLYTE